MRRLWIIFGTALGLSSPLSAQDPTTPDFEGEESEALAALRRAEAELFRPSRSLSETPGPRFAVPASVTSEVAPAAPRPPAREAPWLQGLRLPDLPIRWHDQVVRYLDYFREDARGRRLMRGWMERSTRYGGLIRSTLRSHSLPEDLRCVAMAESGFDPTVRSRRGAVGMWQFVSRTGTEYGLAQSRWLDERMDPVASTEAAARYLGDLHQRTESWELALAAYNMGYGALLRAIRKYNTNDYWILADLEAGLPFETTIYVAKILACSVVMRNPGRFGYDDLELDAPLEVEPFDVAGGVSVRQLARAAGVDAELMATLNPHLRRGRTPPRRGTYRVHIPRGHADVFARAWTRIRPQQEQQQSYVVRFGESLSQVAHRFRTSEARLRELNGLTSEEGVGAGSALLVPAVQPREDEAPEDPPVVAIPDLRFRYPERRRVFYRTSGADEPEAIARFFGVGLDELRRWNHLDPSARLHRGMYLQIFVPRDRDLSRALVLTEEQVRVMAVGTESFYDEYEREQGRVRFRYRVVEGDTLSSIGRRFGISVGSLARINQMGRRTDLRIGQEVVVYADEDRVPARFRRQAAARTEAPSGVENGPAPAAVEPPRDAGETGDAAEAEDADETEATDVEVEGPAEAAALDDAASDRGSEGASLPRDLDPAC